MPLPIDAARLWAYVPTTGAVCNVLMDADKLVIVDTTRSSTVAAASRPRCARDSRRWRPKAERGPTASRRCSSAAPDGPGPGGSTGGQAAFKPGSLRVVAGTVALITGDTVVFRLQGKPGERVVFTFEVED